MSMSSRISRPLLASIFIGGGLDALRHPENKVKAAEKVVAPLRRHFAVWPEDTATLVRVNGGVQVAAALLLSIGKFRRISALALIGSIVPTTFAGHRFWEEMDEGQRQQQTVHFLKNMSILGGLILAVSDTDGAPSLGWKIKRQMQSSGESTKRRNRASGAKARRAVGAAIETGGQAWHKFDEAAVNELARGVDGANKYLHSAGELTGALATRAREHLAAV
jgi:putative oxidoreductase